MVDLQIVCGLPIRLTGENGTVIYEDSVHYLKKETISINQIVPVLLNKALKYPERVYQHYFGVSKIEDSHINDNSVSYDVIEIPHGLLGIEFVKTHVYYGDESKADFDCVVEVMSGELTVMLQYVDEDRFGRVVVDSIEIISLKTGERMAIPTGIFYTFINTGSKTLVFSRVASKTCKPINYMNELSKEKGLACFVISKNARLEIVNNPKYKSRPHTEAHQWCEMDTNDRTEYVHNLISTDEKPLYNLFTQDTSKMEAMLAL